MAGQCEQKSWANEQLLCVSLHSLHVAMPGNKMWALISILRDPASLSKLFATLINMVCCNTLHIRVKGLPPAGHSCKAKNEKDPVWCRVTWGSQAAGCISNIFGGSAISQKLSCMFLQSLTSILQMGLHFEFGDVLWFKPSAT